MSFLVIIVILHSNIAQPMATSDMANEIIMLYVFNIVSGFLFLVLLLIMSS